MAASGMLFFHFLTKTMLVIGSQKEMSNKCRKCWILYDFWYSHDAILQNGLPNAHATCNLGTFECNLREICTAGKHGYCRMKNHICPQVSRIDLEWLVCLSE